MRPTQKEGTVQVSRTILEYGQEKVTDEKIGRFAARILVGAEARVAVGKGLTVNLGNYQSLRVDVRVEVPCYTEETMEVYEQIDAMTDALLERSLDNVPEFIKKMGLGADDGES